MKQMTNIDYLCHVQETCDRIQSIIKRKNADYNSNTTDPFANLRRAERLGIDPIAGLVNRMGDKWQRIESYCAKGKLEVESEGIEDALMDNIGYSIMALAMLHEKKSNA